MGAGEFDLKEEVTRVASSLGNSGKDSFPVSTADFPALPKPIDLHSVRSVSLIIIVVASSAMILFQMAPTATRN